MQKIELTKEVKSTMLEDIKTFFWNERNENISEFQAAILLDFMLNIIGPQIYNQAISDAHQLMCERIEDLYGLEKKRFR